MRCTPDIPVVLLRWCRHHCVLAAIPRRLWPISGQPGASLASRWTWWCRSSRRSARAWRSCGCAARAARRCRSRCAAMQERVVCACARFRTPAWSRPYPRRVVRTAPTTLQPWSMHTCAAVTQAGVLVSAAAPLPTLTSRFNTRMVTPLCSQIEAEKVDDLTERFGIETVPCCIILEVRS